MMTEFETHFSQNFSANATILVVIFLVFLTFISFEEPVR